METKTLKIETYLPVFNGFYNTIWEYQHDNVLYNINETRDENGLMPIEWDVLNIDHSQYEYDTVKNIIDVLKSELQDFIYNIEFHSIKSPEKYNFKNDSVDVVIEPKIENIQKFIYDNLDSFKKYLKKTYTSYDGFISWYSNNFEDWKEYTDNFTSFEGSHYLGSILQFICEIEDITEFDIYESVQENIYCGNYLINYDDCIKGYTCTNCNKIIENQDIIGKVKQYHDIMGFMPGELHCIDCIESKK